MARPKLDRAFFEAQFHNHHHYEELPRPDPEWWEVEHKARGGEVGSIDATVEKALAIAKKVTRDR
jgi:hypothetical protein